MIPYLAIEGNKYLFFFCKLNFGVTLYDHLAMKLAIINLIFINSLLFSIKSIPGCVVQLDRISDFGSEGWGFEEFYNYYSLTNKTQ
jgi:hypothetical protein